MPTLANIQGSSLVPNTTGAVNTLLEAFGTKQQRDAQARAEALALEDRQKAEQTQLEIEQAATDFETGDTTQQSAALARIIARDPKIGKAFIDLRDSGTAAQQEAARIEAERGLREGIILKRLKTPEAKRKKLGQMADAAVAEGKDVTAITDLINLDDDALNLAIEDKITLGTDIKTLSKSLGGAGTGKFTKAPGVIVETSPGVFQQSIPVLNDATGKIEQTLVPITGEPVSRLGETAGAQTIRAIGEAAGVAGARRAEELRTAAPIASEKVRGQSEQQRIQTQIEEGFASADQLGTVNRTLELLDTVDTGNFENIQAQAEAFLGIQGADKTELMANMGTAVLARLRETFGAAFTEREGKLLQDFSAGFGKSTAGNKALLTRAKKLIQRKAQRGIAAAVRNKDFAAAEEIQKALDFKVGPEPTTPAATAPPVLNFDAQGNIIQ